MQIDQTTQQNAALVEQAAAAAASLKAQASKLERTVDVFKIDAISKQGTFAGDTKNQVANAAPLAALNSAKRTTPELRPRPSREPVGEDWEQF